MKSSPVGDSQIAKASLDHLRRDVDAYKELRIANAEREALSILESAEAETDARPIAHPSAVARAMVVPLVALWFDIARRCGVTPKQAADFVERLDPTTNPPLFALNRGGLWAPLERTPGYLWVGVWNAAESVDWEQSWCVKELGFLRLLVADSDRITRAALELHRVDASDSDNSGPQPYLNPQHPRYAPKLAAAVRAWLSVDAVSGKSPKQSLTKWLREHCAEFGLVDDEGRLNNSGIEQCATVANWQTDGGAPKTPTR